MRDRIERGRKRERDRNKMKWDLFTCLFLFQRIDFKGQFKERVIRETLSIFETVQNISLFIASVIDESRNQHKYGFNFRLEQSYICWIQYDSVSLFLQLYSNISGVSRYKIAKTISSENLLIRRWLSLLSMGGYRTTRAVLTSSQHVRIHKYTVRVRRSCSCRILHKTA